MSFRVSQREIAAHEKQEADYGHLSQLAQVVADLSSTPTAKRQHEDSRNGKANAAHERGRDLLDCNVDGQVGRAPEEIDQAEGQKDGEAGLALGLSHGG